LIVLLNYAILVSHDICHNDISTNGLILQCIHCTVVTEQTRTD